MNNPAIKIVALPGSIRPDSSNHKILRFISGLMPANVEFTIYDGIATLPHFDGNENPGPAVQSFRKLITEADGVLVCSPEYAFGVPGSLKNALDWTVYSGDFSHKPLALITASSSGEKAHAALLHIFIALDARIPDGASLLIPYVRAKLDASGHLIDEVVMGQLRTVVDSLLHYIAAR